MLVRFLSDRNVLVESDTKLACLGMGVMLATIWIHLGTHANKINDRLAVHFYSVAFLAFSEFGRIVITNPYMQPY